MKLIANTNLYTNPTTLVLAGLEFELEDSYAEEVVALGLAQVATQPTDEPKSTRKPRPKVEEDANS